MSPKLPAGPDPFPTVPPVLARGRRASLDRGTYFAVNAVHWSTLKAMAESPAHFKYASTHKVTPSPAMLIGQAVHEAVLEPDDFIKHWTYWDGELRSTG